jgi:hypothetical protein
MKRTLTSIAAAVACCLVSTTALLAQSTVSVYDVPFSFNASGVQMPAGTYKVSENSISSGIIRGDNGAISFLRKSGSNGASTVAHLTFHRYGNQYFLRQVWDNKGNGNPVAISKQEREIVRAQNAEQSAKNAPADVVLTATR